jgi:hypothetical protein
VLTRGVKNWWNTRLTPAGHAANIVCVLVVLGVIRALGVPFPVGLAIAAAAGLVLRPLFKREHWIYVRKR